VSEPLRFTKTDLDRTIANIASSKEMRKKLGIQRYEVKKWASIVSGRLRHMCKHVHRRIHFKVKWGLECVGLDSTDGDDDIAADAADVEPEDCDEGEDDEGDGKNDEESDGEEEGGEAEDGRTKGAGSNASSAASSSGSKAIWAAPSYVPTAEELNACAERTEYKSYVYGYDQGSSGHRSKALFDFVGPSVSE
jgi:hypothetical protein